MASCELVDAPEGAIAVTVTIEVLTSASTVGLPLESRTSLAQTLVILESDIGISPSEGIDPEAW